MRMQRSRLESLAHVQATHLASMGTVGMPRRDMGIRMGRAAMMVPPIVVTVSLRIAITVARPTLPAMVVRVMKVLAFS